MGNRNMARPDGISRRTRRGGREQRGKADNYYFRPRPNFVFPFVRSKRRDASATIYHFEEIGSTIERQLRLGHAISVVA